MSMKEKVKHILFPSQRLTGKLSSRGKKFYSSWEIYETHEHISLTKMQSYLILNYVYSHVNNKYLLYYIFNVFSIFKRRWEIQAYAHENFSFVRLPTHTMTYPGSSIRWTLRCTIKDVSDRYFMSTVYSLRYIKYQKWRIFKNIKKWSLI